MTLNNILHALEAINEHIGKAISWLTLCLVLVTFTVVVLRYGFNIGWIWMQESTVYMYAWIFMLSAAYTLKHEGHVRVDILYGQFNEQQKAWVNLLGTLFLLFPMFIFIAWASLDYVIASWRIQEASQEAGGLSYVYLLKSSLLVMPLLMLLQGIALLIHCTQTLLNQSIGLTEQNEKDNF